MKAVVASSVFVAVTTADLALTWKDCGGLAQIKSVTPSSVPLGVKTTLTGSGTSPVKVTGGRFDATVKAGWIPLASCSGPLGPAKTCNLPLGAGSLTLDPVALPIGPGDATISLTVELAASLPAQLAATTTHATAMNTGNQKIVCLDVYLKNGMIEETPSLSGGACSPDDRAKIQTAGGGDNPGSFPAGAVDCAKGSLNFFKGIDQAKYDACLTNKFQISSACAGCYWQSAQYGFENCKFSCMASWCSSKCLECSKPGAEKTNACAGYESPSVPVPCDSVNVAV